MVQTTNREGMRKALDALRIGRDPGIAAADFILEPDWNQFSLKAGVSVQAWTDYGVLPGDVVQWARENYSDRIAVRVILRVEAPTFVDLMAA